MNTKTKIVTALMSLIAIFSLGATANEILAQSETGTCKQVKGNLTVMFGPGTANGVIANGSILSGTVSTAFGADSVRPTADPTSFTFTGVSVITTGLGTVVTSDVYLFDVAIAVGPGMLRIDPANSTGRFAGATGVIYINTNFAEPLGHAQLGGKICLTGE
ncbi:MAG: hypothetical protein ABI857_01870 [Acidobacteriota bacterium]